MYIRTYVVGHAQECHAECRYIPDIPGTRYGPYDFDMCITQSDTFRYARLRYCLAFFGDGDGGRGRGAITAWILQHQTASIANSQT